MKLKNNASHINLLKTKITAPRLREGLIERSRLLQQLNRSLEGKLTVICAPAGFGKSTLLGQWARSLDSRTAWLSLDMLDNDAVRFWRYAAAALSGSLPEATAVRIESLAHTLPHASLYTFIDALMNELHELDHTLALILDDYHVITDQHIHDSLSYAIAYLPAHVHLVVASRTELPFSTSRWLALGELTVLSIHTMQFDEGEAEAFYSKTHNLSLSKAHIQSLHQRTEGWVTGMQLAAVSLAQTAERDRYIEQFQGSERSVSDYLFAEVFSSLPEDIQKFLLRSSILKRMDAELAGTVTMNPNSAAVLSWLEANHLFVLPIDLHGVWYRYHPLFAEFLSKMLERNEKDSWLESHRRASISHSERGMIDDAIDHAIAAGEYGLMEQLLETHVGDILRQGEFRKVLRWFESKPAEAVSSPEWSILYIFILTVTGHIERAGQLLLSLEAQAAAIEDRQRLKSIHSGIFFVRSNILFFGGDYEEWLSFTTRLKEGLTRDNVVFYGYNFNVTEPQLNRTIIGLKGILSKEVETIGLRFSQALESMGWKNSLFNLYVKLSICEGYYEWNRLQECQELLHQIGAYKDIEDTPGLFIPYRILQARLYLAEGHEQLAYDWIAEGMEVAIYYSDMRWFRALRAFLIRLHLYVHAVGAAKQAAELLHLSGKAHPTLNREFEYLSLARLLIRQKKSSQALQLLARLKPQAEREGIVASIVEISLLAAIAERQRGQRKAAMSRLGEALAIAQGMDYARSFLDEGQPAAELLSDYVRFRPSHNQQNPEDSTAVYARSLLQAFRSDRPSPESSAPQASADQKPLTESELGLLRLICEGSSNKQIASELALSEGTVRVYLSRLYHKLEVSSRTQAVLAARTRGLF
ncbi:LuxR family transcriptional regulator [Paenibacillus sp. 1011MAR3C5]|uniref:LuxR C-terminal-related transcriptional regulator n=1 Tax=Paenibacillus sp. 1011MAR3C5 TaxID=1675787 RepID=UPI000E6D40C0|nr:LuxR C-terminal-related transcriptional regulator [Paenibacillus sp. 1011MAR3C5]RJE91337.1 LuxR family transcriptional regulator [Paenibacillus sp. 1011MAR3C5]